MEILEYAEIQHPNDFGLQDKYGRWAKIQHPNDLGLQDYVSELKAQLKIGESDESGACQL